MDKMTTPAAQVKELLLDFLKEAKEGSYTAISELLEKLNKVTEVIMNSLIELIYYLVDQDVIKVTTGNEQELFVSLV